MNFTPPNCSLGMLPTPPPVADMTAAPESNVLADQVADVPMAQPVPEGVSVHAQAILVDSGITLPAIKVFVTLLLWHFHIFMLGIFV